MAAKRHHSSMHHSSHRQDHGEYAMEKHDAGMIGNDHSKFANLPDAVMMKPYPECPAYMDWDMQDNIKGVDKQLSNDNARRKSGFQPHKY